MTGLLGSGEDEQGALWELPQDETPASENELPPSLDIAAPIIAVTGHRPQRITDETKVREDMLTALLSIKPRLLIQGMAAGVDLWSAAAAWQAGIPYHAVKPWAGHRAGSDIAREWVLEHAEEVIVLNDAIGYPGPQVYRERNCWMVDHANLLLAVWDGNKNGGTYHAVRYAERKGMDIVRINP